MTEQYSHTKCLGCGYCCRKAPCSAASTLGRVDDDGGCMELVYDGERYRCNLIISPPDHDSDYWKHQLHIGSGCCSSLNTDRKKMGGNK